MILEIGFALKHEKASHLLNWLLVFGYHGFNYRIYLGDRSNYYYLETVYTEEKLNDMAWVSSSIYEKILIIRHNIILNSDEIYLMEYLDNSKDFIRIKDLKNK